MFFFQFDHQVDMNLYVSEAVALHYSRELAYCTPS